MIFSWVLMICLKGTSDLPHSYGSQILMIFSRVLMIFFTGTDDISQGY